MGRELGRISGPLLAENLLRNGVNLAFETDLLYFDVTNGRIGIRNDAPGRTLFVNNYIQTTNLIVDTGLTVPDFSISGNTIQQLTGRLYIKPNQTSNPTITATAIGTSLLTFDNNELKNATDGSNIELSPIGTGITNIRNSVNVYGGLHATGNITWDGDITLGNDNTDNISFVSEVQSDIIPNFPLDTLVSELSDTFITQAGDTLVEDILESYNLGAIDKTWATLHSNIIEARSTYADYAIIDTAYIGNYRINGANITNNVSGEPMYLTPSTDSALVNFNGTNFIHDNRIINQTSDALTLQGTDNGYIKFAGTYGLVIPSGPTVSAVGAQLGQLRYNTELGYVRVFNGTEWISAIGSSTSIALEDTYDIMDIWTLVLG